MGTTTNRPFVPGGLYENKQQAKDAAKKLSENGHGTWTPVPHPKGDGTYQVQRES
jgi:hypothetical protein